MANENEPAKLLLPYLQRADELQKHEPLVAYYCRLYAMERGLKIPQSERTKTTNSILISLMNQLEKDKKSLKLGPDDHLHLEGFALNVFAKADKQDRAGRADLSTAKTFYAASIFFEILNQFGELQPDLEQKQKYAAWKAADIRKALKEGRKPVPGPPGGDQDPSLPSTTSSGEYDHEPSRTDLSDRSGQQQDPSPQFYDEAKPHHGADIPPSPSNNTPLPPPYHGADIPPSPSNNKPSPPPYRTSSYPSHDFQSAPTQDFHVAASQDFRSASSQDFHSAPTQDFHVASSQDFRSASSQDFHSAPTHDFHSPLSTNLSENSTYSQSYHHQPFPQEPQQHYPQNYVSHEVPSYSYPNFQSYPSFTETTLPAAPANYPSYYQGSDSTYSSPSAPMTTNYSSTAQYNSNGRNGSACEAAPTPSPPPAQMYQYDSNYQPPPDKIAEAHKAARFAVGALAFDDVSVAVDYLKKSLELLTNPSASH
ncbi:hypothetical protein NMG60_11037325 [Bertholletia excelsa]